MEVSQKATEQGMIVVRDFWKRESQDEVWRTWKSPEEWMDQLREEQKDIYQKEMQTRRIHIRTRPDILRWG